MSGAIPQRICGWPLRWGDLNTRLRTSSTFVLHTFVKKVLVTHIKQFQNYTNNLTRSVLAHSLYKFILLGNFNFGSEVGWLAKDSEDCKLTAHNFSWNYLTDFFDTFYFTLQILDSVMEWEIWMIDYWTSFFLTIAHRLGNVVAL